jgi:glycine cleavage system transcriptional repressor
MTVLGGEFAVIMSIAGAEDPIAALESEFSALCQRLDLACLYRATSERDTRPGLPYAVRVVAMDHPGIVHEIASFFSNRQINIEDLSTETQRAAHTGTPIFNLTMRIQVPAGENRRALRTAFEDFCEERDLDGGLEAAP